MTFLAKANKYLRDPAELERTIRRNARASSLFEGASPRAFSTDAHGKVSAAPRSMANSKKRDKAS